MADRTDGDSLDLEPLIAALRGARGASRLFLSQAMQALAIPGAAGEIRIQIPGKKADRIEVAWLGHPEAMEVK